MKLNIEFLLVAYFVGMIVDWISQTQWQAINKSFWTPRKKPGVIVDLKTGTSRETEVLEVPDTDISLKALLRHSWIYAMLTSTVLFILVPVTTPFAGVIVTCTLFLTHAAIDSRIPVKWIMRWIKGMSGREIFHKGNFGEYARPTDRAAFCTYEAGYLAGIDAAINAVQKRFMGDLNREDMEVRRCVESIKKLTQYEQTSP